MVNLGTALGKLLYGCGSGTVKLSCSTIHCIHLQRSLMPANGTSIENGQLLAQLQLAHSHAVAFGHGKAFPKCRVRHVFKTRSMYNGMTVLCDLQDAFLHICQQLAYALHGKMGDMLGEPYALLAEQRLIHTMTAGSEVEDPEAHQLSVCS